MQRIKIMREKLSNDGPVPNYKSQLTHDTSPWPANTLFTSNLQIVF